MGGAFLFAAFSWWFFLCSSESVLVLVCELQKNRTYQVPWGSLWPSTTNSVGASVPRKTALTYGVGKLWNTSVIDKCKMWMLIFLLVCYEKYPWWIQHGLHQDKYISLGLLLRGLQIHAIWRGIVYGTVWLESIAGNLNLLLTLCEQECFAGCVRKGGSYFWCYDTLGGWDYCSPSDKEAPKSSDDVTIYNEKCLTACDTYGKSYFWCW